MWLPHVKVLSQIVDMHIEEEEATFKKSQESLTQNPATRNCPAISAGKNKQSKNCRRICY